MVLEPARIFRMRLAQAFQLRFFLSCLVDDRTVLTLLSNPFCVLVQVRLESRPTSLNRSVYAGCTSKQRKFCDEISLLEHAYPVQFGTQLLDKPVFFTMILGINFIESL
ncbi:unnamed protein product [Albugo candida]|uniref:Uncharacterized protein n=1 Tax=Albugo candida TaxID=65357 RepID=A0A024G835_9STRA|nr:unnamed protein product [Albugo candida]|eukprot:CCI43036.1 unnamed protein product [Albugo candida]